MSHTWVLTTGEEGGQPIRAGSILAALRLAGIDASALDLSHQELTPPAQPVADVVLDLPDFPAVSRLPELAPKLKELAPDARLWFTGSYAQLNETRLASCYGGTVLRGEAEEGLLEALAGIPRPQGPRRNWYCPDRGDFLPLSQYPQATVPSGKCCRVSKVQGNLETSRGCHHRCRYCSVYALYDGRQSRPPLEITWQDVEQQVKQGAEHFAFVDADFFSYRQPALELLPALHERHPGLTFEVVTRVDHILEVRPHLEKLRRAGLVRITSSLEFPAEEVLREIDKGFHFDQVKPAIEACRQAGIELKPTFILFNPWVCLGDISRFRQFLAETGLEQTVDPVQLRTRLLLYKGSPLLQQPSIRALPLTEHEFHFEWKHPDPGVDALFERVTANNPTRGRCCVRC